MTARRASSSAAKSPSPANGDVPTPSTLSGSASAQTSSKKLNRDGGSSAAVETSPSATAPTEGEMSDDPFPEDEAGTKAGLQRNGSTRGLCGRNRSNRSRSKGPVPTKTHQNEQNSGVHELSHPAPLKVEQGDGTIGRLTNASLGDHKVDQRPSKPREGITGDMVHRKYELLSGQDGASEVAVFDLAETSAPPSEEPGEGPHGGGSIRRQRSSSMKELAGLGLAHLGDGDAEVLMPRRSRRAAGTPPGTDVKDTRAPSNGELSMKDVAHVSLSKSNTQRTDSKPVALGQATLIVTGEEEGEGDVEGVTRCVCGSTDENVGLMIQCESCKCWQHCICMGMNNEEDCPDVYYCEQCKPELHIPLLRLLGVLPTSRSHKKGGGRVSGKNPARDAAKELKEAKAAVAILATQNAERRKDGKEPLVANTAGRQKQRTSPEDDPLAPSGSPQSQGDAHASGRRSPKRRSTMNSRDSMYGGWEAIPPGLLNDDEVWDRGTPKREDDDLSARKRKRAGRREEDLSPSPAASVSASLPDASKKRRMSSGQPAGLVRDGRKRSSSTEQETVNGSLATSQGSFRKGAPTIVKGAAKMARATAPDEASAHAVKPKQPNQYTYRKERTALAAAATAANGRPASPTPSPSKSGRRGVGGIGGSAFREGSAMGSRSGTPPMSTSRGAPWGLPEHLSHLSYLLPSAQPEPLILHMPTTKAAGQMRGHPNLSSTGGAESSSRPSPHAFSIIDFSEAPTKIRFPGKRMTIGEMRKRVRNISDYVTRTQIEAVERGKRMRSLGIRLSLSTSPAESTSNQASSRTSPAPEPNITEKSSHSSANDAPMEGVEGTTASTGGASSTDEKPHNDAGRVYAPKDSTAAQTLAIEEIPLSMRLLDDLTRELIAFQQKYGVPPGSATMSTGTTLSTMSSSYLHRSLKASANGDASASNEVRKNDALVETKAKQSVELATGAPSIAASSS